MNSIENQNIKNIECMKKFILLWTMNCIEVFQQARCKEKRLPGWKINHSEHIHPIVI